MARSVVVLTTYPLVRPRHGGQVRAHAIVTEYQRHGFDTRPIAIYEPEQYGSDETGRYDVPLPATPSARTFHGESIPLITDFLSGSYGASDGFKAIQARLPDRIDVIHIEQCWLWPVAIAIRENDAYSDARIVLGTQNIEHHLKKKIFDSYGVSANHVLREIEALEHDAACRADVMCAVTEADALYFSRVAQKDCLVAANGVTELDASEKKCNEWAKILPAAPFLLYVASAHPPNFKGLSDMLGGSLGFIPPDSRLVVVGSVCEHIYSELKAGRFGSLNLSRLNLLYKQEDADLMAIKKLAHGYLLPIRDGGGSNLKTAEAIFSTKYVLGSDAAYRGYQGYLNLPELFVARSPAEFHAMGRAIFALKPSSGTKGELRTELTWGKSLQSLFSALIGSHEGKLH